MNATIRRFFEARGVLEVETPLLGAGTNPDPNIEPIALPWRGGVRYLQSSPEFAMKRLLVAGTGPIYQICKAFRDDEQGRLHNPEFTLLEWYRPGWEQWQLMDEIVELLGALKLLESPPQAARTLHWISYRQLFIDQLGIDPWQIDVTGLARSAAAHQIELSAGSELDHDGWLDLLLSHLIAPRFPPKSWTLLYDYPPSQAALAKVAERNCGATGRYLVAERFELFYGAVEIANGFHELTDVAEQKRRFQHDLEQRRRRAQIEPSLDTLFLDALNQGLPHCAGVAFGLDRLLMAIAGADHLAAVLPFPADRA